MQKSQKRRYHFKSVQDLCFTDDFMFGAVMRDEHICKGVIERLLHIKVDHIEYPETQKENKATFDGKGVRFDVYIENSDKIFDIEAQVTRLRSIGKRMRYYQSMIDIDNLSRGEDYNVLKESYIIFLCLKDQFNMGLPVYTFERVCKENKDVILGDKTHHIVYNVEAALKEEDEELRNFLLYLKTKETRSEFTREIEDMVETKKFEQSFINYYLGIKLHESDVRRAGLEEGIEIGEKRGMKLGKQQGIVSEKQEVARRMLLDNISLEQVAKWTGLSVDALKML